VSAENAVYVFNLGRLQLALLVKSRKCSCFLSAGAGMLCGQLKFVRWHPDCTPRLWLWSTWQAHQYLASVSHPSAGCLIGHITWGAGTVGHTCCKQGPCPFTARPWGYCSCWGVVAEHQQLHCLCRAGSGLRVLQPHRHRIPSALLLGYWARRLILQGVPWGMFAALLPICSCTDRTCNTLLLP
jgi:hypothetical protein